MVGPPAVSVNRSFTSPTKRSPIGLLTSPLIGWADDDAPALLSLQTQNGAGDPASTDRMEKTPLDPLGAQSDIWRS